MQCRTLTNHHLFPHGSIASVLVGALGLGCAVTPGQASESSSDTITTSATETSGDDPLDESTSGGSTGDPESSGPSSSTGDVDDGTSGGITGETASTTDPEETTGTTGTTGESEDVDYDILDCPVSQAVEMIVPGRAELVAFNTVGIYWRQDTSVHRVQIWLSSDDGDSFPYFVDDVVVSEGESTHLELWDSTLSKIEVHNTEGVAKPSGYRMALAAFDVEGALLGCSETAKSFEIRGWPDSAFEIVGEIEFADEKILKPLSLQADPGDGAVSLTELDLAISEIDDISGIAHFTRIEDLNLPYNDITSLYEISWMSRLETLDVAGNYDLMQSEVLPALGTLTALQYLRADGVSFDSEGLKLFPLLPDLRELRLEGSGLDNASVAALPAFPSLETLCMRVNGVTDLASIPYYPELKVLELPQGEVSNPFGLHSYPKLERLDLSVNNLTTPAGLPTLTSLQDLSLFWNHLISFSGLPNFPNLRRLHAAANKIVDLSSLPELPKLEHLNLIMNDIQDVSALAGHTSLKSLWLDQNKIQNGVKSLATLSGLNELSLAGNPDIPCADQEYVKTALLTKNPNAKITLSAECK